MTIREFMNDILNLPAWTLIIIIPLSAFFGGIGAAVAKDLHSKLSKEN